MSDLLGQPTIQYWLPSADELKLFGPDFALVGTIIVILVGAMIVGKRSGVCAWLALAGLVVAFFLNMNVAGMISSAGAQAGMEPGAAPTMLIADNLTVFFKGLLFVFAMAVIGLWMIGSAAQEKDAPEFMVLLLGSALGMSLMVSTLNLLMIIIAIELASLPSYAMVAFDKRSRPGAEGAMKYVVFGSISAGIMVYGASLLYGMFGTLDVPLIAVQATAMLQTGQNTVLLAVAVFMFLVGVGFKISAVPFHFWCPDVFEGAKIEVTTWLSVVSKAAGICLLMRIMYTAASAAGASPLTGQSALLNLVPMTVVIGVFAAVTCFVGNLAAYRQTSVKRLLAYSSIAHAGYMLALAAIVLRPGVSEGALLALVVYLGTYLFMNLGAFGATALVVWKTGSDDIEQFNGLGRRAPILAFGMTVCLFSLVGMPPLAGFWAKLWLLMALANEGGWLWWLVVWVSLNTLFSLFYYLRIMNHMYFKDDGRERLGASPAGVAVVSLCAVVLMLGGTFLVDRTRTEASKYAQGLFESKAVSDGLAQSE